MNMYMNKCKNIYINTCMSIYMNMYMYSCMAMDKVGTCTSTSIN